MTKLFYDHLIIIEEVLAMLNKHSIPNNEQREIMELVDLLMHQEILSTILTHLPNGHHEFFLIRFHALPHDKRIIEFINEKSGKDMEKEILKTVNSVKKKVAHEISQHAK